MQVFYEFEAEQQEKQREEEIKKILRRYIPVMEDITNGKIEIDFAQRCYNELKEEGYLK